MIREDDQTVQDFRLLSLGCYPADPARINSYFSDMIRIVCNLSLAQNFLNMFNFV